VQAVDLGAHPHEPASHLACESVDAQVQVIDVLVGERYPTSAALRRAGAPCGARRAAELFRGVAPHEGQERLVGEPWCGEGSLKSYAVLTVSMSLPSTARTSAPDRVTRAFV